MRKRLLVKEGGIGNFFRAFFGAKEDGKEEEFIDAVAKADKDLADALDKLNKGLAQQLLRVYAALKARGKDTTEVEASLKKYGIPIPK